MSTLKADTIQSTGGGAATLTKQSAAKAWFEYTSITSTALAGSFNISGVTDNGTGDDDWRRKGEADGSVIVLGFAEASKTYSPWNCINRSSCGNKEAFDSLPPPRDSTENELFVANLPSKMTQSKVDTRNRS